MQAGEAVPAAFPYVTLDEVRPAGFAFEAAIFDFDGTLADSCGVWEQVDRDFFAARGLACTPEYAARMAALGFEDGARYTRESFGLADSVQDICDEWNRMGRVHYARDVQMFPGVLDYVRALKARGVPVAIATTNDPQVLAAMEPRVPLSETFGVRVHGCEVPRHSKEHPDIFLEAARRLGVDPAGCVVFEDSLTAIRTAQAAGMRCVGHASGSPSQPLGEICAQTGFVVDSWGALLQ